MEKPAMTAHCIYLRFAVSNGDKHMVKSILNKGADVDCVDSMTKRSALYEACLNEQEAIVKLLLKHSASPNQRCADGSTCMHAACLSCNVPILVHLINAGGDLRLHDRDGRTPRDYALRNGDCKRRQAAVRFLDQMQRVALEGLPGGSGYCHGCDAKNTRQPFVEVPTGIHSRYGSHDKNRSTSNLKLKRDWNTNFINGISVQNFGFGKVRIISGEQSMAPFGHVPLIPKDEIRHDHHAVTYCNGPYMVMEGMMWNNRQVTIKRVHQSPLTSTNVDLLINESDYMLRLRHPNLLLLMGVIHIDQLQGLALAYERIDAGSLHHLLYHTEESFSLPLIRTVFSQTCEALKYMHESKIIHGMLSSHAIHLVSSNYAKLGNLEYAIGCMASDVGDQWVFYPPELHGVMAPELLNGQRPTVLSDIYGLTVTLWEALQALHAGKAVIKPVTGETCQSSNVSSWVGISSRKTVEGHIDGHRSPLNGDASIIAGHNLTKLLDRGMAVDPIYRPRSVEEFKEYLIEEPKKAQELSPSSGTAKIDGSTQYFRPLPATDRSIATSGRNSLGWTPAVNSTPPSMEPIRRKFHLRNVLDNSDGPQETNISPSSGVGMKSVSTQCLLIQSDGDDEVSNDEVFSVETSVIEKIDINSQNSTLCEITDLVRKPLLLPPDVLKRDVNVTRNEDTARLDNDDQVVEPVIAPTRAVREISSLKNVDRIFSGLEDEHKSNSLTALIPPPRRVLSDAVDRANQQSSIDSLGIVNEGGDTMPSASQVSFLRQARQKESRASFLEKGLSPSVASIGETQKTLLKAGESEIKTSLDSSVLSVLDNEFHGVISIDQLSEDYVQAYKDLANKPLPPPPKFYLKAMKSSSGLEAVAKVPAPRCSVIKPTDAPPKAASRTLPSSLVRSHHQINSQTQSTARSHTLVQNSAGLVSTASFNKNSPPSGFLQSEVNVMSHSVSASLPFANRNSGLLRYRTTEAPEQLPQQSSNVQYQYKRGFKPATHHQPSMFVHLPVETSESSKTFETVSSSPTLFSPPPKFSRLLAVPSTAGSHVDATRKGVLSTSILPIGKTGSQIDTSTSYKHSGSSRLDSLELGANDSDGEVTIFGVLQGGVTGNLDQAFSARYRPTRVSAIDLSVIRGVAENSLDNSSVEESRSEGRASSTAASPTQQRDLDVNDDVSVGSGSHRMMIDGQDADSANVDMNLLVAQKFLSASDFIEVSTEASDVENEENMGVTFQEPVKQSPHLTSNSPSDAGLDGHEHVEADLVGAASQNLLSAVADLQLEQSQEDLAMLPNRASDSVLFSESAASTSLTEMKLHRSKPDSEPEKPITSIDEREDDSPLSEVKLALETLDAKEEELILEGSDSPDLGAKGSMSHENSESASIAINVINAVDDGEPTLDLLVLCQGLNEVNSSLDLRSSVPEVHVDVGINEDMASKNSQGLDKVDSSVDLRFNVSEVHVDVGINEDMVSKDPQRLNEVNSSLDLRSSVPEVHVDVGINEDMASKNSQGLDKVDSSVDLRFNVSEVHVDVGINEDMVSKDPQRLNEVNSSLDLRSSVSEVHVDVGINEDMVSKDSQGLDKVNSSLDLKSNGSEVHVDVGFNKDMVSKDSQGLDKVNSSLDVKSNGSEVHVDVGFNKDMVSKDSQGLDKVNSSLDLRSNGSEVHVDVGINEDMVSKDSQGFNKVNSSVDMRSSVSEVHVDVGGYADMVAKDYQGLDKVESSVDLISKDSQELDKVSSSVDLRSKEFQGQVGVGSSLDLKSKESQTSSKSSEGWPQPPSDCDLSKCCKPKACEILADTTNDNVATFDSSNETSSRHSSKMKGGVSEKKLPHAYLLEDSMPRYKSDPILRSYQHQQHTLGDVSKLPAMTSRPGDHCDTAVIGGAARPTQYYLPPLEQAAAKVPQRPLLVEMPAKNLFKVERHFIVAPAGQIHMQRPHLLDVDLFTVRSRGDSVCEKNGTEEPIIDTEERTCSPSVSGITGWSPAALQMNDEDIEGESEIADMVTSALRLASTDILNKFNHFHCKLGTASSPCEVCQVQ